MWCRLRLMCVVLVVVGSAWSCGPPPLCDDDAVPSALTINPNGSSCQRTCECNNQNYEGFCSAKGVCDAVPREACGKAGERRGCLLRPRPAQGTCGAGVQVCEQDLRVEKWGDCKPLNKEEPETSKALCGDGIDNDCDGQVDKSDPDCQAFCNPGQTRPCYTGDKGTQNVGSCAAGVEQCDANEGTWSGACLGQILPQPERCNRKDDDCNGKIDDNLPGCVCEKEGSKEPCYGGPAGTAQRGNCKVGFRICEKAGDALRWGACQEQVLPRVEACNESDDNCNGLVDEGCPCAKGSIRPCGTSLGLCRRGEQRCIEGAWDFSCYAEQGPTTEICDGRDNDCNGLPDDNLVRSCQTACGSGEERCVGGLWQHCTAPPPQTETCDNKDNDCNGKIDDGVKRPCKTDCGDGIAFCSAGVWVACTARQPQPEVCDNKDNDCDGQVDNNVREIGAPCTNDTRKQGECQRGRVGSCQKGMLICESNTPPSPEICDGKDNDCDGTVDNGAWMCVEPLAGSGTAGDKDGPADKAEFRQPIGLLWTPGRGLLVVDSGNHRIRRFDPTTGQVSTWVGSTQGFAEGTGTAAKFDTPFAIQGPNGQGAFFVSDTHNHRIRGITSQGQVVTYAGNGQKGQTNGANFAQTTWNLPRGIRLFRGALGVVDSGNGALRSIEVQPPSVVDSFNRQANFGPNFSGLSTYLFGDPVDVAVTGQSELIYLSDAQNHQVLWVDISNRWVSVIGSGKPGLRDGSSQVAQFRQPMGLAVDALHNVYVADTGNHCIRKISPSGHVTTIAGTGTAGHTNGFAPLSQFRSPMYVAIDGKGNLTIADSGNHRLRTLILAR